MPTRDDTERADHAGAPGPVPPVDLRRPASAHAPHGRARELAALERFLDRNEPDIPLIEVSGDPWIGKSSLLGALGDLAHERGWTVASASGGSVPEGLPFGVFADALDDLLTPVGDAIVSWLSPHHLSWLAGIFPVLSAHAPAVALPENPSERNHVFHAIRTVLDHLGSRNRLLLILDDMHLADDASVLLLQYLLRHPTPHAVLAIAHRPRQDQHSLRILLCEASVARRSVRLDVQPLPDEDISGLLPRPFLPAHLRSLLDTACGHPGLLRALTQIAPWTDDMPGDPGHPADASMPLLREFRGLSVLGWTVAHAAAVVQEPFDTALLAEVAQVGEAEARTGVDELARLDILRPDDRRGTFRFRDPLVLRAAQDTAGAAWQLGAHARAAAALRDRASPSARIAWHLSHGVITGQDTEGAHILEEAARTVLWERPDRAAGWLRAALDRRPDGGDPQQRLLLGTALALSGELTESLSAFEHRLGEGSMAHPEAALWRARVLGLMGRHPESADLLEKVIANLPPDAHEMRARTRAALLATCLEAGEFPRLAPEDVVATAELDPALQALLLALQVLASRVDGDSDGRPADLVRRAAHQVDELADDVAPGLLDALYWVARAESALGMDTAALGHLERALDLALRHRLRYVIPQLATEAGRILLVSGDTATAKLHADHARLAAERIGSHFQAGAASALRERIELASPFSAFRSDGEGGGAVADAESGLVRAPQPEPDDHSEETAIGLHRLSEREREISVLVSKGRTNQQIARALALSPKTVETYLARVFKKLALCSRAQLATLVGMEGRLAC